MYYNKKIQSLLSYRLFENKTLNHLGNYYAKIR